MKRPAIGQARPGVSAPELSTDPLERDLQTTLTSLLSSQWMKRTTNGIQVMDRKSGKLLFSFGADRQLNPASNVKLVSTATALDALGPDFTYKTRLLGTKPTGGSVEGDVYLVGNTDPTLRVADLAELVEDVRARGIERIGGDIVVGPGDSRDAPANAALRIRVVSGPSNGDLPEVILEPDSPFFSVAATARTNTKLRRPQVGVSLRVVKDAHGEHVVVNVEGKIKPAQELTFVRTVPRAALFAGHTLRAALILAGVQVEGGVHRASKIVDGAVELARHDSRPLSALVAMVNKPSSNFLADRVIWTTGAEVYGGAPTNASGLRAMAAYLKKIGISEGSYRVDNGSGLSHTNHFSAKQILAVLLSGASDFRIAADYLASFSVGGRDGTLRNRFRGHAAAQWVRGKTGTLNGTAALSGFVSAGGEDEICFSILTNGFRKKRLGTIRANQVAMVDAMYRFLVKRRGGKETPVEVIEAPMEIIEDGDDSETSEESLPPSEDELLQLD